MKKILAILLAMSLMMGITACGNTGNEGSEAKESPNASGEDTTDDTAGEKTAGDDVIELSMWRVDVDEAEEKWYQETLAAFNETYDGKYHVTDEIIARTDSFSYDDKINAAVLSNSLPDVIAIDGPYVSSYAANDIIVPLDDYISDEDRADYMDASIQQGTYDGKLYALSATETSVGIFYNKDMLEAIGVTAPDKVEDAWTWSEYYEICKQLTTDTVAGANIIMDKGEGIAYVMQPFWVSNHTDLTSPEGDVADGYINSPEGVEAAEYLNKFIQEGIARVDPLPNEFQTGSVATVLTGPWEIPNLKENYPDLNWGVTYFPVADNGGKAVSPTGGWCFAVSDNSEHEEAAAALVTFMTNAENSLAASEVGNKLPSRKSAFEKTDLYDDPAQALFKEQLMTTGYARPRTPSYGVLTARFSEAMVNIFSGADVQSSLDSAAQFFDEDYQAQYAD